MKRIVAFVALAATPLLVHAPHLLGASMAEHFIRR